LSKTEIKGLFKTLFQQIPKLSILYLVFKNLSETGIMKKKFCKDLNNDCDCDNSS